MRNISESPETFKPLELVIKDPDGDKGFMVGFGDTLATGVYSKMQMDSYNDAIESVLDQLDLRAFHQIGDGQIDGAQLWEIRGEVDRHLLEKLIPSIHSEAAEIAKELESLG